MTMVSFTVASSVLLLTLTSPEHSSNVVVSIVVVWPVIVVAGVFCRMRRLAELTTWENFGNRFETIFQTEALQMKTRKMKTPLSMFKTPMMLKTT